MYKSPIELIADNITNEIKEKIDKYVYECVQRCGLIIDEAELIKALQYDREQYFNGYRDGHKDGVYDALPKWIPCNKGLPEIGKYVLCQCRAGIFLVLKYTGEFWEQDSAKNYMIGFVISWMQLPEPYEVDEDDNA